MHANNISSSSFLRWSLVVLHMTCFRTSDDHLDNLVMKRGRAPPPPPPPFRFINSELSSTRLLTACPRRTVAILFGLFLMTSHPMCLPHILTSLCPPPHHSPKDVLRMSRDTRQARSPLGRQATIARWLWRDLRIQSVSIQRHHRTDLIRVALSTRRQRSLAPWTATWPGERQRQSPNRMTSCTILVQIATIAMILRGPFLHVAVS